MLNLIRKRKAQSAYEYVILITFILTAYLVFQKYLVRGFSGRWKSVGDSFGQGRIYSFGKTQECAWDFQYMNVWYDVDCYEARCDCLSITQSTETCQDCIIECSLTSGSLGDYCDDKCDFGCAPTDLLCQFAEDACIDECNDNQPTFDGCADT